MENSNEKNLETKILLNQNISQTNTHSKLLSVTPDKEADDIQIIGLKVQLNDRESYSFPIKTRCNSSDARATSTNPLGLTLAQDCSNSKHVKIRPNSIQGFTPSIEKRKWKCLTCGMGDSNDEAATKSINNSPNPNATPSDKYPKGTPTVPLMTGESLTGTEKTSPNAQTSVKDLRSPKNTKKDSCEVSNEIQTKTSERVQTQTVRTPENEVEVQLEKETSTGSSQTKASASISCNSSTQTEQIKDVATSTDLIKAEGVCNYTEESCRWPSSCEHSENDGIDSTSDNEWKSPGRGIWDPNDEAVVKNTIKGPRPSYSSKYANGTRTVPLMRVSEASSAEPLTEPEITSSTNVEVLNPITVQELRTHTINTCDVSTETREEISCSMRTEIDGNPKNEVELQTEKGISAVCNRIAKIYSIAKAYDASAQTEMVEDVSTNFNNNNIVSIEELSEKSVDTDNLKFVHFMVAQAVAEDSYSFCGQQKQQDSTEECCCSREYKNSIAASFISSQNGFTRMELSCNCLPRKNSYETINNSREKSENVCPKHFWKCATSRRGVEKIHYLTDQHFKAFDNKEITCGQLQINSLVKRSASEIKQSMFLRAATVPKSSSVAVLQLPVTLERYLQSSKLSNLHPSKVAIYPTGYTKSSSQDSSSRKENLRNLKSVAKAVLEKAERVSVLQVPVTFSKYLESSKLHKLRPSKVVINPTGITLARCHDSSSRKKYLGNIKTVAKAVLEKDLKSNIENPVSMFPDGAKKKPENDWRFPPWKSSISSKMKTKTFDYISKEFWTPYDVKYDEFLSRKTKSTKSIHAVKSSSHEKRLKSIHLNDACETVNNHLLGLRHVDENTVRLAAEKLHKLWFAMIASDASREVGFYIRYFGEFSNNLVKTILHSVDSDGNNAFHVAFANNRFDCVHELLRNGFAAELLTKENKLGNSPLLICSISQPSDGAWSTVRKSFELGNVNAKSSKDGRTPLMLASSSGSQEMVDLLLGVGADPNLQDKDGSTALMYAAEHGCEECVRSLVTHGKCDPTKKGKDGETACSIALDNGYKKVADVIHAQTLEKRKQSSRPRNVWTTSSRGKKKAPTAVPRSNMPDVSGGDINF